MGRINIPEPVGGPMPELIPVLISPPVPGPTIQPTSRAIPDGLEEYLPFLRYLYENRDELYQLITSTRDDGIIPRYAIPGEVKTKAI